MASDVDALEAELAQIRHGVSAPQLAADWLIALLPKNHLASLVGATTTMSPSELASLSDLPGFASRLSALAMDGVVTDSLGEFHQLWGFEVNTLGPYRVSTNRLGFSGTNLGYNSKR